MTGTEPAVSVRKVGYAGFETPDLDRLTEYYTKVLDFALVEKTATEAYLTTNSDHHSIVLRQGEQRARSFVGYEIDGDLKTAQQRLKAAGYEAEYRSDAAFASPEMLVVREAGTGVPLELYSAERPGGTDEITELRPVKLGHIAAFVDQLAPIQSFYQDLLGFKWSDTIGDFFVFLRCNSDHHAANFMVSETRTGMNHIAYEMRDLTHLQTMFDHLSLNGYQLEWGPGRHGPGHNIFSYHHDPDGNVVELFTQLDTMSDEASAVFDARPWHRDSPQAPKTWEVEHLSINSWGYINPAFLER
ncbi:MAG TPA: VOC family protein [Pseudolysinimonas sp.]|nr:VOC family protein [Pseudolysinimonas sp.]